LLAPEPVDEPSGRDDLVGPNDQDTQEGALLASAEGDLVAVLPDGEWPEDAEFQGQNVTPATSDL